MTRRVLLFDIDDLVQQELEYILENREEFEDIYDSFEEEDLLERLYDDHILIEGAWEDVCSRFGQMLEEAGGQSGWEIYCPMWEPYVYQGPADRLLRELCPEEGVDHLEVRKVGDEFSIVFNRNTRREIWVAPNLPRECPCCRDEFWDIEEKESIEAVGVCIDCYRRYGDDWEDYMGPTLQEGPLVLDTRFLVDGIPYGF